MNFRRITFTALFGSLALIVLVLGTTGCGGGEKPAQGKMTLVPTYQVTGQKYTVAKGDYIDRIAANLGVSASEMVLVNRAFLQAKFVETCDPLSERYTNNPGRRGTFCNERYKDPFKNTLRPGWQLDIPVAAPQGQASRQVEKAVETHTKAGDRVAIVIDATGSMTEDREVAAQLYMAALRKHGRNIQAVYFYRDGDVWSINNPDPDKVRSQITGAGETENTFEALRKASDDNPDAIILITDEIGDDWPGGRIKGLKPVIANCLPDRGGYECGTSLRRLVADVGGQYVAYRR